MTWEEIIIYIRTQSSYKELVEFAYFEEDLPLNVERFRNSDEFKETLNELHSFFKSMKGLLIADIGAGNGIATLAFALEGANVVAVEPDPSHTIGSGAIRKLEGHYKTGRVKVEESFGEKLPFPGATFDIVYIRQAMHHAGDLPQFTKEAARILKPGGILMTARDHVIYDEKDKRWFLDSHPLHRFYGGENAFTYEQYANALSAEGLKIRKVLRHYDSVINFFPENAHAIMKKKQNRLNLIDESLRRKLPGFLAKNSWVKRKYASYVNKKLGILFDESKVPGRLITFITQKPR